MLVGRPGLGQEFIPRRQNAPPGPPLSPAEAIRKMTVPAGFHVELVAAEPDLLNPVAMAFDDRGRIYVTESFEYPRHEPGPGRDRIKILEDTDGDGRVDSVKVFAEGLNIPSGIAVGHGGVWVANAPDILFLEDTDGDDVADRQTVVVTGFGRDDTHELPNALTWGPDGYLYGLNGVFNRSVIQQDGKTFDFTCALFRIHPRTKKFELFCQGTSNPWGVTFDGEGSAFISACVIDHLWHLTESAYYQRQGGPYPPHTWWADSIVKHQHQMAAYCGIEYFDSDAYPEVYRNKLYMGNIHGGCINSDRVERAGATYKGMAEPDFLTANDVWFMPVAQKVGPDGCLYVLDWYDRYHCYQDASADPNGVDRGHGRLYRIVHDQRPPQRIRDVHALATPELIRLLGDPNLFYRQRAQLELSERRVSQTDPAATKELERLVFDSQTPSKHRMHALWALTGSGPLGGKSLLQLLQSKLPELRAWGIRIAGNDRSTDADVKRAIAQLAADSDPRVRIEVSIATPKLLVGQSTSQDNVRGQVAVLRSGPNDPITPRVVWQNMQPHVVEQQQLIVDEILGRIAQPEDLLRELAPRIAARLAAEIKPSIDDTVSQSGLQSVLKLIEGLSTNHPVLAAGVAEPLLQRARNGEVRSDVLRPLLKGWWGKISAGSGSKRDPGKALDAWDRASVLIGLLCDDARSIAQSKELVLDRGQSPQFRREIVMSLGSLDARGASPVLRQVVEDLQREGAIDRAFRDTVLDIGVSKASAEDLELLFDSITKLKSDMQTAIAERLCQREETALPLLSKVVDGTFRKELIGPNRVRLLAGSGKEEIRVAVAKIWGNVNTETSAERETVISKMADSLRWDARGDAERGWLVYDRICGQCHVMHGRGAEVGPNITANGRGSYEQLLVSVFHPSLVIGDAYKSVTLRLDDGSVVTGLLVERTEQRTVIKLQGGKEQVIPAADIEEYRSDKKSLMPEGIENQMTPQELADLFALLTLESPPNAPTNAKITGTPDNLHSKQRP